jgi:hypothetical protein
MRSAVVHRLADCVRGVSLPRPTKWQRVADEIDAAIIFARSDFVNGAWGRWLHRLVRRRLTLLRHNNLPPASENSCAVAS